MYEGGESPTDFELVGEAERIVSRLELPDDRGPVVEAGRHGLRRGEDAPDRDDVLAGWLDQATRNHRQLLELLASVHRHRIPPPHGTQESLVEYDRRRSVKETLLEEIIQTCVETADAARMIRASMDHPPAAGRRRGVGAAGGRGPRGVAARRRGRSAPRLSQAAPRPGRAAAVVRRPGPGRQPAADRRLARPAIRAPPAVELSAPARAVDRNLPAAGDRPTHGERAIPSGPAAHHRVRRHLRDRLQGDHAMPGRLVRRMARRKEEAERRNRPRRFPPTTILIDCLEQVVEVLAPLLAEPQPRRAALGAGERRRPAALATAQAIHRVLRRDLFTQQFMNLGNLRGILHQGVEEYLKTLLEEPDPDEPFRLLADLDGAIPLDEAAHWLGVAIEAVVENYGEYIDYNSITTQSDRGEMLYTLLDFLRLRASYDRLAWNLRPVMLAHQVLVRCGRDGAAEIWREAIAERTAPLADEHLRRFDRLCKKYGMRLPSIAEHLAERFVRPLEIDRLCALMRPAIDEVRNARPPAALRQLEEQIAELTAEPSGAGFELPSWLEALDQELDHALWPSATMRKKTFDPHVHLPQVLLSRAEVERQVQEMLGKDVRRSLGDPR